MKILPTEKLNTPMKNTKNLSLATRINGADRRHLIIESAVHLFAKHGFHGTTTKQIAFDAGVSEAGLFQYFKTKAELYTAIWADKAKNISDDWLAEIRESAGQNDDENFFQAVASKIFEQCRRDEKFLRLMFYSALEGHVQAKAFYERQIKSVY